MLLELKIRPVQELKLVLNEFTILFFYNFPNCGRFVYVEKKLKIFLTESFTKSICYIVSNNFASNLEEKSESQYTTEPF